MLFLELCDSFRTFIRNEFSIRLLYLNRDKKKHILFLHVKISSVFISVKMLR